MYLFIYFCKALANFTGVLLIDFLFFPESRPVKIDNCFDCFFPQILKGFPFYKFDIFIIKFDIYLYFEKKISH